MSKIKKLSLTDLVLYGLVFMVPIAPVSLYGVVALLIKSKVGWSLPNPPGGLS